MRKWYKRRGGYLPRIPWIQRPKWYRAPVPWAERVNPPRPEFHVPPEIPFTWDLEEKVMKRIKDQEAKRYKPTKVVTVPMSSDQKKLLETTKPGKSKKKRVQSPKGARPTRNPRTTQLDSQKQNKPKDISADKMPRRKKRMTKRMFRKTQPKTKLRAWLRPGRRKPKLTTKVTRRGTGASFSTFSQKLRRPRRNKYKYVLSTFPWNKHLEVKSAKFTGGFNVQSLNASLRTMDRDDVTVVETFLPTSDRTGSFLLTKVESMTTMSNMSNANVFIDIIDYHYRKDSSTNFADLWNTGLFQVSSVTLAREKIGMTPFMSPLLTAALKIDKITTVELGSGQSHRHKVTRRYNKIFNLEELIVNSNTYFKDWTAGTAYIMRGEPVNGNTEGTKTVVNTAETAVDFFTEETTTFKYAQPIRKTMVYTNAITTLAPGAGRLIDEASGAVENIESA